MDEGDKYLDSLWSKRPLNFQPFLPEDNSPDITSNSYAWLQHQSKELSWLLHLKFPKFVSYVLYDPNLRNFLDSFLRYRSRPYDNEINQTNKHELLTLLDKRIFFLFARLTTYQEIEALVSSNFSIKNVGKLNQSCQFGELVSGETGVLSLPKLMDFVAIYHLSNARLTMK